MTAGSVLPDQKDAGKGLLNQDVVYGYPLKGQPNGCPFIVDLPKGAYPISVVKTGDSFRQWAITKIVHHVFFGEEINENGWPKTPESFKLYARCPWGPTKSLLTEQYEVIIYGTGHPFPHRDDYIFLNTIEVDCGEVYHIFYRKIN